MLATLFIAAESLTVVAFAAAEETPERTSSEGIAGNWLGTLKAGAVELRVLVKIKSTDEGTLSGKLDSLDQGVKDLPIDVLTLEDSELRMELKSIGAVFEGTLNPMRNKIDGNWRQGGNVLPLEFEKIDKPPEIRRPQEPNKPYPYRESEVAYDHPEAEVKLAGTLTLPRGDGPFPAALLISGSGPQDRDESLMGHRPFLVLADSLTRRGIAVLRVDDRGVGGSTHTEAREQ